MVDQLEAPAGEPQHEGEAQRDAPGVSRSRGGRLAASGGRGTARWFAASPGAHQPPYRISIAKRRSAPGFASVSSATSPITASGSSPRRAGPGAPACRGRPRKRGGSSQGLLELDAVSMHRDQGTTCGDGQRRRFLLAHRCPSPAAVRPLGECHQAAARYEPRHGRTARFECQIGSASTAVMTPASVVTGMWRTEVPRETGGGDASVRWADGSRPPPTSDARGWPSPCCCWPPACAPPPGNPDGTRVVPPEAAVDTSQPDRVVGNGTPRAARRPPWSTRSRRAASSRSTAAPTPVTITLDETAKVRNDTGPEIVIDGGGT